MPRGLSTGIKTELGKTAFTAPIYSVRITRATGDVLRWAERGLSFNDGTGTQAYEARLMNLSGLNFSPDEAGQIQITVANVDAAVTTLDRTKSFQGAKCEVLAWMPDIAELYILWTGWADEVSELTQETATLIAYPSVATPNVQVPKRLIGLPCPHVFANTANWVNVRDFEGSECPYQRMSGSPPSSSIGFVTTLVDGALDATTDPISIRVTALPDGRAFAKGDAILIDSERFQIFDADVISAGKQFVEANRAQKQTVKATHAIGATVKFANCDYSVDGCLRRGMYGNNSADTYAGGTKKRNYFGGFPALTGYQYGTYRSKLGERDKPLRLVFSGNDSSYGRPLPLIYGKVRVADPILLIAKPEGDFLTTLWAVGEGLLATNAADDTQTTPNNAYVKTTNIAGTLVENIFVNGVSRHDPRPGFGIEVANGDQDRSEPGAAFFPAGTGQLDDFIVRNLGFWGTARVTFRINQKSNPSVDIAGQSVTGAMEIAWGRVHRVYSDATTYVRRATADGSAAGANPAFVIMDILQAKRAGAGLDYSRLNIQSFVDVATYCNATVTNTFDGSTVKRWTFNGILDQRKSLQEWLHIVSIGAYSLPPYLDKDGKLKIRALKSEALTGIPIFSSRVASATGRNIVWENDHSTLMKSRRPLSEVPNEIRVNFVENAHYSKISVTISDRETQSAFGENLGDQSRRLLTKSIDLPGTTTLDEAARLGTLILRAGEFGQGGLANNLKVTFKGFYRDVEDLEVGDVIEVEDGLLDPALNERYFRVIRISAQPMPVNDGGMAFAREIEAVLHDNAIYDDSALTVSKFDRVDPPSPSDFEPPPVTSLAIAESGDWDANDRPVSKLTITYVEPNPKENFRSVLIYKSNDTGGSPSAPVGDWRFVGELLASGESLHVENTGNYQHFAAVSRSLSGHPGDINAVLPDGSFKYPRLKVFIDGITDVLPAPSGFQIFLGVTAVFLQWSPYTGNDLKLFKSFKIYRNTVNNLGTASNIATLDGTLFIDSTVSASTTYYYWVKGLSILNIEGPASGPLTTTSPANAGVDSSVPTAPLIGSVRNQGSFNSNEYEWLIGIDAPGGATNWAGVSSTTLQISTDPTFATFPTGISLNRTYGFRPPMTEVFRVNTPGTYYFRAKVTNSFGDSAWSSTLTRTTNFTDNLSADTSYPPAPSNLAITVQAGNTTLAGNEFEITFEIPATNTASYWGYSVYIHDSSTLPIATTQETGTAGSISAGSVVMTDLTKAWTVNQWVGKDLVIFHPDRTGSPTFDYEGLIILGKIVSNTATTITMETPTERQTRTHSGANLRYYVVNNNAGHHFWEKLKFTTPALINEGVLAMTEERASRKRKLKFASGLATVYAWVALYNLHAQGKVTGSPVTATFSGISTNEIKLLAVDNGRLASNAVTTTKIADNSISTPKLIANSVTAAKIDVTDLFAQTITASGSITGLLFRTASSGSRLEIDSTNGLRAFNGSNVVSQIMVSGAVPGAILTKNISGGVPSFVGSLIIQAGTNVTDDVVIYTSDGTTIANRSQISLVHASGINFSVLNSQRFQITNAVINSVGLPYQVSNSTVINGSGQHVGDGSLLTSLNASNLASGSVPDGRLTSNVPLKNAANTFTAAQTISGAALNFTSGQGIQDAGANSGFVVTASVAQIYANGGTQVAEFGTGALKLYVGGALRTVLAFNDGLGHNVLYY